MGIVQEVSQAVVGHFDPYGLVQTAQILRLMDSLKTVEEVRTLGRKLLTRREKFELLPAVLQDAREQQQISFQIGALVRTLYHGKAVEMRLAAVEALSHHMDDQRALHHAIFHDKDRKVRVAAAVAFKDDGFDPLPCESEDEDVRIAFARNTRLQDILIAMALKDPSEMVRRAAVESRADPTRSHLLTHLPPGDARLSRYYHKHGP